MSISLPRHIPVLPAEVLHYLDPQPGQVIVDATFGGGGHAKLIAERLLPGGRLIALDRDAEMIERGRHLLQGLPAVFYHAGFDQLAEVLQAAGVAQVAQVDGVLADLGICSDQLDEAERGFSFQASGPLDMRLDRSGGEPASALLRRLGERELADLIFQFGEERCSRRIARKIVETRRHSPLETTDQLADLVRSCVPRQKGRHAIDPATRTFQALRIAVNDELGALDRLLAELPRFLKPGGRAVVISFHSLEDRRVKQAFADRDRWETLTRKPVQATEDEERNNPRARSAKLRAARKNADCRMQNAD
jgi:16S rRNA (cytosine1402-N4)-methyltransferase